MGNLEDIVRPLYTDAFTVNTGADAAAVMGRVLADDFQSIGSAGSKTKAQLIGQIQFFWKLVPDLKWDPQEILQVRAVPQGHAAVGSRRRAVGSPCARAEARALDVPGPSPRARRGHRRDPRAGEHR